MLSSSGLTLVPWVIAFGIPGRVLGRLPARAQPVLPVIGCGLLAAAYASISASMLTNTRAETLLLMLLAVGGLGWEPSSARSSCI